MPVRGEYVIYLSTNPRQREASPSPPTSIFSVPTHCESNLSKNREIEFNAGTTMRRFGWHLMISGGWSDQSWFISSSRTTKSCNGWLQHSEEET